jgi:Tfp pilus assembly protein PilP
MRSKAVLVALLLALAAAAAGPAAAQKPVRPGRKPSVEEAAKPVLQAPAISYDAAGRRDPFRDLLGGQAIKESHASGDPAGMAVEEIQIVGVIKAKGAFRALIAVTDGFPLTAREGDRFADGYILSIREGEVVFRKTHERGVPLTRPKDIVRDITSEER